MLLSKFNFVRFACCHARLQVAGNSYLLYASFHIEPSVKRAFRWQLQKAHRNDLGFCENPDLKNSNQ